MSLLKMTILSFKASGIKQLTDIPRMYMVMFNPASYKREFKIQYETQQPDKDNGSPPRVKGVEPETYNFDFLVDGTGAAGFKRNVFLDVESFKKTVGFDKSIGKGDLRYLVLLWGTMLLKCKIESISVNYTLFDSAGIPLRATISASFKECKDDPSGLFGKMDQFFDSDPVAGAMSVANVAFSAFNSVSQTVSIAQANDLDSIREKVTGSSIQLPK